MQRLAFAALLAGVTLSGCTTATEIRTKPIAFQGVSNKSVSEVAVCVTGILKAIKHGIVANDMLPNGVAVSFNVNGQFGNIVWIMADIENIEGQTRLTVRGIGRPSKNPAKDYVDYSECLAARSST